MSFWSTGSNLLISCTTNLGLILTKSVIESEVYCRTMLGKICGSRRNQIDELNLQHIYRNQNVSLCDIHCIGHSLGNEQNE